MLSLLAGVPTIYYCWVTGYQRIVAQRVSWMLTAEF
jgi:hypothetical protein